MENGLTLLWKEKKYDEDTVDYLFQGIRCTSDIAYKLGYILGTMLDLKSVYIAVEDEDGVYGSMLEIPSFEDSLKEANEIFEEK